MCNGGTCCDCIKAPVDFSTKENADDFVTFQWCNCRWLFAIYRIVVAIYFTVWLILCILWANMFLIYLTYWTLAIFTGYLILSALLCIVLSCKPKLSANMLVRGLLSLSWFVYYIVATLNPIIVIMFWTLVYKSTTTTPLSQNITIHFLNGIFIAFNLVVSAQPHKLAHVWIPMLYASLYFIFMGLWYKDGQVNEYGQPYIYSALDFSTDLNKSVLLILGFIFIAIPVVHIIIWILTRIRVFIYEKCCCGRSRVTAISPEPPQMVQRMSVGDVNEGKNLPSYDHAMATSMTA